MGSFAREVEEVVAECRSGVYELSVRRTFPDKWLAYFSVRTKEDHTFLVEMTQRGFRLVADESSQRGLSDVYETLHALLLAHSPGYRSTFDKDLFARLEELKNQQHHA